MEEVFGLMGQAILSAIAAASIIGISFWLLFGLDGSGGPLGNYIMATLGSVLGA